VQHGADVRSETLIQRSGPADEVTEVFPAYKKGSVAGFDGGAPDRGRADDVGTTGRTGRTAEAGKAID